MDKPEEKKDGKQEEVKPIIDAFGQERTPEGKPVVAPELVAPKVEEKGKEGEAVKPEDIEKNPVVIALRDSIKKLEDDKSSMGENLSSQRKQNDKDIKALKDRLTEIEGGKKNNIEPLFKDIKRVKDLPKDEQEAMTDSEKKLFDDLADTREKMNKLVEDAAKKAGDEAAAGKKEEEDAVETEAFNTTVQAEALRLASGDKAMANSIIEEFNAFRDNDKLSEKDLKARIEKAAKLVPDYKPPQEQKSPAGGAAKPADAAGTTEIDKIVEEAKKGKSGGTYAL